METKQELLTLNGKEYLLDIEQAKQLGLLKEKDSRVKSWEEFAQKFPENVEVRQVSIPLLRRYYSFHMKDAGNDTVNVKYYTYANSKPSRNYQPIFHTESEYFRLYREEFDYLWEYALK